MVEVMHFYHWTWEYVCSLPLKLFWTLVKSMHRLRAAQNLRMVQVNQFNNLEEASRREYIQGQENTIGTIVVSDERDAEGVNKLKHLGG